MASESKIVTGLDIGTTRTTAVIAEITAQGDTHILGMSTKPTEGVRNGVVVHIESAMKSVVSAIESAEIIGGCEATHVVTSVGGSHINHIISPGLGAVTGIEGEITREDIRQSIESAKAMELPNDREIVHAIPLDFIVDGQHGIMDPLDMLGHRLESRVMIITASKTTARKTVKVVTRGGFEADKVLLKQLAAAESVLTAQDREIGTLLIDIGAGTINVIGIINDIPRYVKGFDLGGEMVTADLAYMLNKPRNVAEDIKKSDGCCHAGMLREDKDVIIPQVSGWPAASIPKREICKIIEPRMEEIFAILQQDFLKNNIYQTFNHGIVLTGGGALLSGTLQLASEIFEYPVKLGVPAPVSGLKPSFLSPEFATAIGTVLHEARIFQEKHKDQPRKDDPVKAQISGEKKNKKIKEWFSRLF